MESVVVVPREQAVKVESILADPRFPNNLQGRIRFETDHRQLVFRGFMSKSEYDQLQRFSQDVHYQVAVTKLFQLSTVSESPQLRQFGRVLVALTIACLLLTAIVWWSLLRNTPGENDSESPATSADRNSGVELAFQNLHSQHWDMSRRNWFRPRVNSIQLFAAPVRCVRVGYLSFPITPAV